MRQPQHDLFFRLWAEACAAQGWDQLPSASREARRYEMLAACGFDSLKEVDPLRGFDRVKARLAVLANRIDIEDQAHKRALHTAVDRLTALHQATSEEYVKRLLKDRFHVQSRHGIADLSAKQLGELIITCNARLKSVAPREPVMANDNEPF